MRRSGLYINPLLIILLFQGIFFSCWNNKTGSNSSVSQEQRADTISQISPSSKPDSALVKASIPPENPKITTEDGDWMDLSLLDPTIRLDLRYATDNNFVKEQLYQCGKCYLRPPVAEALLEVQQTLLKQELGLKLFDCFRPRPVQQKLWEKVPNPMYVTNPEKGSMHNRGAAVDLTIVDANGVELDMGTDFDFFGHKAYHSNTDLPENILNNRKLLKTTMENAGFRSIRTEWWHYAYVRKSGFPLSDYLWDCDE